jgi:hypothetical protein
VRNLQTFVIICLHILSCVKIASPPDKQTSLPFLKPAKVIRLLFCKKPLNVIEYLIPARQGKSFAVPAEIDYDYSKSIDLLLERSEIIEKFIYETTR